MIYSHTKYWNSLLNRRSLKMCSVSYSSSETGEEESPVGPGCDILVVFVSPGLASGGAEAGLRGLTLNIG